MSCTVLFFPQEKHGGCHESRKVYSSVPSRRRSAFSRRRFTALSICWLTAGPHQYCTTYFQCHGAVGKEVGKGVWRTC